MDDARLLVARADETMVVARGEYDMVWRAEGWAILGVADDEAEPDGPDLSAMTKAELVDVAAARGVEIPASATKADILAALEG